MSFAKNLLILGTGQVGRAVIKQARASRRIIASTRNPNRIFELLGLGVEPLIMPLPAAEIVQSIVTGADVLVTYPPDGDTDSILAPACTAARRIVYISSTGVYGSKTGRIDENTEVDYNDERMRNRLSAEEIWRKVGAVIFRCPGIYGSESGLHKRLKEGCFKLPDEGNNVISRIHIYDLASIITTYFSAHKSLGGRTFLVGDESPCSIRELVSWLCREMQIPLPESVPANEVNHTLRGNRSIDGSLILRELGIKLMFPNYKDGYRSVLSTRENI